MTNNKFILNCVLVFSIVSLLIAYFVQYVLGHKPCNLCIIERIPYLAAVIFISLIFVIKRFEMILSSIVLIFFVFGALISSYHVGIEQGIFNESLVCTLEDSIDNLSKDQMLQQLKNAPISCKDVTFRFLGFSLATINTVISVVLSVIMLVILKKSWKKQIKKL